MTNEITTYSDQDITDSAKFIARMLPYMASGMTFEEAGKSVISQDQNLFSIVIDGRDDVAMEFKKSLAKIVYDKINSK